MSAIAGVWRQDGDPSAAGECGRMLAAQAIYGPHGEARWAEGGVALGRRLFRTLPEDRYDQGVAPVEGGGWLVADVRLDNRPALARRLGLAAGVAKGLADASLLAAAWTRWGDHCFDHLVGDYAFALWDAPRQRLVLARDPLGHRPLHLHRSAGLVAFASMPRGLHVLEAVPLAPDEASLASFLALRPEEGSATFFAGVERVEPGCVLVVGKGGGSARRHYAPSPPALRLSGPDEYAEALRERLDEAVEAQLRVVGGRVGAHLSSGMDSAAVTATAARLLARSGGRVTAFTAAPRVGFAGGAPFGRHADESRGAAAVAAMYDNIEHVIVRGDGRSPLSDLDRDIALCGRPMLNPCNHLWYNDINRAAQRKGLGVMLTGDFGNLGLTDDGLDALPDLVGHGRWATWVRLARAVERGGALRWRGVLAASFEPALPPAVGRWLRRLVRSPGDDLARQSALTPDRRQALPSRPAVRPGDRLARRLAALTRMDLALYAKGALAGTGVDVRDPLTDRRLLEFCLSIPIEQLVADGRPRALARRALSDRLPAPVLAQDTRGYQAADWHEGLTADQATAAADVERLAVLPVAAGLLDIERLRGLVARWPVEGWDSDTAIDAYRLVLLRGLAVGRFITQTVRANG